MTHMKATRISKKLWPLRRGVNVDPRRNLAALLPLFRTLARFHLVHFKVQVVLVLHSACAYWHFAVALIIDRRGEPFLAPNPSPVHHVIEANARCDGEFKLHTASRCACTDVRHVLKPI